MRVTTQTPTLSRDLIRSSRSAVTRQLRLKVNLFISSGDAINNELSGLSHANWPERCRGHDQLPEIGRGRRLESLKQYHLGDDGREPRNASGFRGRCSNLGSPTVSCFLLSGRTFYASSAAGVSSYRLGQVLYGSQSLHSVLLHVTWEFSPVESPLSPAQAQTSKVGKRQPRQAHKDAAKCSISSSAPQQRRNPSFTRTKIAGGLKLLHQQGSQCREVERESYGRTGRTSRRLHLHFSNWSHANTHQGPRTPGP